MAKFTVEIDTSNDAFEDCELELADVLQGLARKLRNGQGFDHTLRDSNGNRVGSSYLEDEEDEEDEEDSFGI